MVMSNSKNVEAPKGPRVGVFAGKRFGFHSDPEDDGGGGVSDLADANHESACPFDPYLIQASANLGSHVVLPSGAELMVDDKIELLELAVYLCALELIPRSGVGVRQQAWGGGQPSNISCGVPCETGETMHSRKDHWKKKGTRGLSTKGKRTNL